MSKTVKQLTETTTLKTYDLIHVVDIDNDQDKKITSASFWSSKPYAELYVLGNSTATNIAVAGTKVNWTNNGATSSAGDLIKFTHDSANGRLTYTGEGDIKVLINVSSSIGRSSASTNRTSGTIYISGAEQTKSEMQWLVGQNGASPSGRRNGVCTMLATLSKDDYVEYYISNEDDTDNQIVSYLNMNITTL